MARRPCVRERVSSEQRADWRWPEEQIIHGCPVLPTDESRLALSTPDRRETGDLSRAHSCLSPITGTDSSSRNEENASFYGKQMKRNVFLLLLKGVTGKLLE